MNEPARAHAHVTPVSTYLIIFAVLMALLVLTVGVAYVHLGEVGLVVALLIAAVKAALIVLYFMHVLHSSRLTWIFSTAAFLWLAILLVLTMSDYVSRAWFPLPGR